MAVDMEEVLIVDMQHWRDALRTSFNRTVGSRYLLNKKYLPLPVLSTDKLNTLEWILSLTLTVQSRIWMSLLLLLSLAKRAEKNKFDRYPHINLVPFILETTGRPGPHARKFINFLLRDADTHHWLSETLGPPSNVSSTVPSPNNNSRPLLVTAVTLQFVLYAPCLWMQVPSRRERTQPFSVSSLPQPCHVALL